MRGHRENSPAWNLTGKREIERVGFQQNREKKKASFCSIKVTKTGFFDYKTSDKWRFLPVCLVVSSDLLLNLLRRGQGILQGSVVV